VPLVMENSLPHLLQCILFLEVNQYLGELQREQTLALGPTDINQILPTRTFIRKLRKKLLKIFGIFFNCFHAANIEIFINLLIVDIQ
jgi:hypothetical protein